MFLKNHAKSKVFQNNKRPQAFFVKILCQVGDSIFIAAEVSTKRVHSPSGVQRNLRTRRGAPSLRMRWDGMGLDGVSKVSFKFLYTLEVYRTCIGLLIYMFKICRQHFNGFENFMLSW